MPALLATKAAVSVTPIAASSHQIFPRGTRKLCRAGSEARDSADKDVSRITHTESAPPNCGITWNPSHQNITPNPIAASKAQPAPADQRCDHGARAEAVEGGRVVA